MISCVRVDNRLIHGQVIETWLPHLGVSRVVVADDEAAANPLARAAMGLCVPPEVEVKVEPLSGADFSKDELSQERVLLLVRDVSALAEARSHGLRCPTVNIGNVHFGPGRRQVTTSVFLSDAELDCLRCLCSEGVLVELRAVPRDRPLGLQEIEARACKGPGGR
jgi:PTS system mannose-specific IIB component